MEGGSGSRIVIDGGHVNEQTATPPALKLLARELQDFPRAVRILKAATCALTTAPSTVAGTTA